MPLRTLVKVGRITNLSDARYCAGMGVEMLGFRVIQGRENYLAPKEFQEIRGWVTGPRVVAEISGIQSPAELPFILENYKPDFLELGLAELAMFREVPLPFILYLDADDKAADLSLTPSFVLSQASKHSKTGVPFLLEIKEAGDVEAALEEPLIHGIAMNGSAEIRPGLKEYTALAEILELLDAD